MKATQENDDMMNDMTNAAPVLAAPSVNRGYDPRAVSVAREVRERMDAECVILFGSRSRADWTGESDIDLMAIVRDRPDQDERTRATDMARRILDAAYSERDYMPMDLIFMAESEYRRRAKSVNHVAAIASREGIKLPRDPEDYAEPESEIDDAVEREDRVRRIADANVHYDSMNGLLDMGRRTRTIVYHAHQALENGMKALVSALGRRYPHTHNLNNLADAIIENDKDRTWRFDSDLTQLSAYAGGDRYFEATNPVTDFTGMANTVTDDLSRIYRRIAELTGEDPWSVPPDEGSAPISPRRRDGLTDSRQAASKIE